MCTPVGRVPVESVERRERPDNLEQLDLLEEEDDLETMDPKETLYDTHNEIHTQNDIATKISEFRLHCSVYGHKFRQHFDLLISEFCFCV